VHRDQTIVPASTADSAVAQRTVVTKQALVGNRSYKKIRAS
jgi:hypothetical protein